ncbi:MAG: alginate export family protein [Pirellula sp.]|nr:alginate export family protein [Pirellula sp.]
MDARKCFAAWLVATCGLHAFGQTSVSLRSDAPLQSTSPEVSSDSIPSADAPTPPEAEAEKKKKEEAKKKAEALKKKVAGAYKDPFFLNDFSYLKDPNYNDWHLGESLKQIPIGEKGTLDFGGQYRLRHHDEQNFRGLGLNGRDDDFLLDRTRFYFDYKMTPRARVFAEFLDAGSSGETFGPRVIEVQHLDAQNLFAEYKVIESQQGSLNLRAGRQELLYGQQRLLSPLDWANNRRRFDGFVSQWNNDDRATDLILVRPDRIDFDSFDAPDQSRALYGVYDSNKTFKNPVDLYYLVYEDTRIDEHVHTVGILQKGEDNGLLWEGEFGYQFGRYANGSDISAGAVTVGLGRKGSGEWAPTLWGYYDWASGGDAIGEGWNHLFPLVHRYQGFMDLFGRRNIHDINVLGTITPTKKWSLLAWYHYMLLANTAQGPYTAVLTPFNPGGTVGGRELGHELDLLSTYKLTVRSDLVLGFSYFWSGDYYDNSLDALGNPLFDGDASFFYTQWHYNF